MSTNPLKVGLLAENSAGIGSVSREMVRQRAIELSAINGHAAGEVSKSDWEQAKRELTGQARPDMDPRELVLESVTEGGECGKDRGAVITKPLRASVGVAGSDGEIVGVQFPHLHQAADAAG